MSSGKIKGSQGFSTLTSHILYFNQGLDNKVIFFKKIKNCFVKTKTKTIWCVSDNLNMAVVSPSMKRTFIGIHGFYVLFKNKIRISYKVYWKLNDWNPMLTFQLILV